MNAPEAADQRPAGFHAGVSPTDARYQIGLLGRDVLPVLQQRLGEHPP